MTSSNDPKIKLSEPPEEFLKINFGSKENLYQSGQT